MHRFNDVRPATTAAAVTALVELPCIVVEPPGDSVEPPGAFVEPIRLQLQNLQQLEKASFAIYDHP